MKVIRAALYLRVSTRDGNQDTENQRLQLRQFCQAQSFEMVREYQDHESGSRSDRTQFRQMLQDASTRKWDLLVFWALDRFTREGTLATLKHLELLESYGVRWRNFTELIRRMSRENPLWGAPRTHGELLKLGIALLIQG